MKKVLTLTRKELLLTSRDRPALVLVIIAPLALMTVLGLAFGRGDKLSPVPVVLVNQDHSEVGRKLVEQLRRDASELLVITERDDVAAAYKSVDDDQAAAAVVLPDLTAVTTAGPSGPPGPTQIDIYANPARAVGAGVVKTFFSRIAERLSNTRVGTSVT
ncbi:MAG: ABC transporter permease, partial [Myxococcales bacterium]|nr:ABC transporter permease [Myxococcales bacterium]